MLGRGAIGWPDLGNSGIWVLHTKGQAQACRMIEGFELMHSSGPVSGTGQHLFCTSPQESGLNHAVLLVRTHLGARSGKG